MNIDELKMAFSQASTRLSGLRSRVVDAVEKNDLTKATTLVATIREVEKLQQQYAYAMSTSISREKTGRDEVAKLTDDVIVRINKLVADAYTIATREAKI